MTNPADTFISCVTLPTLSWLGVNTVLIDDPQLTSRCGFWGGMTKKQPLRVIVDADGKTPVTARVFSEPGSVLLAVGEKVSPTQKRTYTKPGAEVLVLSSKRGMIDLEELLQSLGKRQITSVLIEGGSTLLGSLCDQNLVDKMTVFIAPIIIGGEKARTAIGGKGIDKVVNSLKLERIKTNQFDNDLMITGYIGRK